MALIGLFCRGFFCQSLRDTVPYQNSMIWGPGSRNGNSNGFVALYLRPTCCPLQHLLWRFQSHYDTIHIQKLFRESSHISQICRMVLCGLGFVYLSRGLNHTFLWIGVKAKNFNSHLLQNLPFICEFICEIIDSYAKPSIWKFVYIDKNRQ